MTPRQSFKQGFIASCIERGITTPEAICAAAKTALDKQASAFGIGLGLEGLGEVVGHAGSALGAVASYGIPALLAGPPIVGAIGGALAAKGGDVDDYDVQEAKSREVNDAYLREAARLRREGQIRRQSQGAPARRPLF